MVSTAIELRPNSSLEEVQLVIRAVYKGVLGNPHVMESERLRSAESQLADGSLTVRGFVRAVGQSDLYRTRYFERMAPNRFVELNFMHFLGRSPQTQAEVSEHIVRCVREGYAAEINSYLDSAEYLAAFGEQTVPYNRGTTTETGLSQITYNRMVALDRGPAQVSSAVRASQIGSAIARNGTTAVKPASATVIGSGTEKRLKIVASGAPSRSRMGLQEYVVPASKMSAQIQRIQRSGSKIVSVTEVN